MLNQTTRSQVCLWLSDTSVGVQCVGIVVVQEQLDRIFEFVLCGKAIRLVTKLSVQTNVLREVFSLCFPSPQTSS